jgi:GC-rich sequence DNA-binding factor
VEELEEALLELCQGRAAAMERRRAAGDAEEHAPAEAAVSAAAAVLSRGGELGAAAAAADAAAAAAEEKLLGLDLPVELDEFGRDTNAERKAELAQRAKQRRQRLQALEQQLEAGRGGAAGGPEQRFGEQTSEESEGEVSHFRARQGEVQEAADAGEAPVRRLARRWPAGARNLLWAGRQRPG